MALTRSSRRRRSRVGDRPSNVRPIRRFGGQGANLGTIASSSTVRAMNAKIGRARRSPRIGTMAFLSSDIHGVPSTMSPSRSTSARGTPIRFGPGYAVMPDAARSMASTSSTKNDAPSESMAAAQGALAGARGPCQGNNSSLGRDGARVEDLKALNARRHRKDLTEDVALPEIRPCAIDCRKHSPASVGDQVLAVAFGANQLPARGMQIIFAMSGPSPSLPSRVSVPSPQRSRIASRFTSRCSTSRENPATAAGVARPGSPASESIASPKAPGAVEHAAALGNWSIISTQ